MSGKASHRCSTKTAPTTDKATVLGNQSQASKLTSLATDQTIRSTTGRERGVIYPSVMIAPQRFCGLTKTYLDHLAGVQAVSTNILPRRSVSKHHKEQRSLENRFSGNRLAPNQRPRSRHPLLSSHECTSTHVRSRPRFLSLHIVCFLAVLAGLFFLLASRMH